MLIIGCGYIGTEVGALWKKMGHTVTATTQYVEQINSLFRSAQKSVIWKEDEKELVSLMENNDLIFIEEETDLETAKMIRRLGLEMDPPRQLIYISSSSVYGDHHGQWVDETSELKATKEHAKNLIDIEKTYLSLNAAGWSVCTLRLSEIYGPGREISKHVKELEGHIIPGAGDHYTNMVHKFDCIDAVNYAFHHHLDGIYNLSDDEHPTRKELYDSIAQKFNLPLVKWNLSHIPLHMGNKRVSNHKIKAEGFVLRHPIRVLD